MIDISKENIFFTKRIFKYLFPFKKKIMSILFIMIISAVVNYILPILNKEIIDNGLLKNDFTLVLRYALLTLALVICDQLLGVLGAKLSAYLNNMFNYKLTSISIRKLINVKMPYLSNKNFTEIMNNINMDAANVSRIVDQSFVLRILNIFKIVGGFIGLIKIDYRLSIIILIIIPVKYILTGYFTKLRKTYYRKYMEYAKDYSNWYGDKLGGIKEIKLSGIENIIMKQFSIYQRKLIKTNIKSEMIDSLSMASEICFFQTLSAVIYIISAMFIIKGSFTIGGLFAFTTYSVRVIQQLSALFSIKYDFAKIILSAKRLFEFMDTDSELNNKGLIRLSTEGICGNIEFKDVCFSYSSGKNALKNINFKINPGEKVAIAGLNGSGKSTILNVLLKLYEPQDGGVFIDGVNLKDINTKDVRQAISMVNQQAYLFNATIRENISLFKYLSQEEISNLMKLSGAYDFVNKLPHGIETKLGDKGSKLSGGEMQKIVLARAFYKKSKIIILDEVTSNFDMLAEKQFNETLMNEFKGSTVILITHRPYILKKVDKIIVLDKGRVAAVGKHDELVSSNEIYSEIVNQVI